MATTTKSETRTRWVLGVFGVGAFVALMTLEVVTDEGGVTAAELLLGVLEFVLSAVAIGGIVLLSQRMQSQHDDRLQLMRDLKVAEAEGRAWRDQAKSYVAGLGAAIESQFEDWELTEAEREVGLLMLKGFTHQEVAALRATTAATTRQQAHGIYRKSKLPNRTAFAAYFMEDLLPMSQSAGSPPSVA